MKKNTKIFIRTVHITSVILLCLTIALWGAALSYEGIRKIGFGEQRRAIEIEEGTLHFFDFEIKIG